MGSRLTVGIILTVISVVVGILGMVFGTLTPTDDVEDILLSNGDFRRVQGEEYIGYVDEYDLGLRTYIRIDSAADEQINFNLKVNDPFGKLLLNATDRTPYEEDVYTSAFAGDFEFRIKLITPNATLDDIEVEIYDLEADPLMSIFCCGAISLLSVAVILFIIGIALIISHFTGQEDADKKAKIRPASEIVDVNIGSTPPPQQQMRVVQQPMGYPPQGMPPQHPPQQGGYPPQGAVQQQYPPQGPPPQHPPRQASPPPEYGYGGVGPGG